ncbi:unnamed protein product, partial [Symbiodinium sp. CCMP2592]
MYGDSYWHVFLWLGQAPIDFFFYGKVGDVVYGLKVQEPGYKPYHIKVLFLRSDCFGSPTHRK